MIKRQLVNRFEAGACRQAAGDARQSHRLVFQKIDKIICGRFAFDIRRERENNLRNRFSVEAFEQFLDPQIVGGDMIERRDFSSERVVSAAERARFLQGKNVGGLFDDAE